MNVNYKKGLTLVETIIAIAIFTMVTAGVTLLFSRVWTLYGFTIETGIASLTASRGVENVVKVIRKARISEAGRAPLVSADDNEFIFYADIDGDDETERVRYFFDDTANTFNVGVTEPTMTESPPEYNSAEVTSLIASHVMNDLAASENIFTYYDEQYSPLVSGGSTTALTTPLDTAGATDITIVKVLLYINIDPMRAPENIRVQSFVVVRNVSNFGKVPT